MQTLRHAFGSENGSGHTARVAAVMKNEQLEGLFENIYHNKSEICYSMKSKN